MDVFRKGLFDCIRGFMNACIIKGNRFKVGRCDRAKRIVPMVLLSIYLGWWFMQPIQLAVVEYITLVFVDNLVKRCCACTYRDDGTRDNL